MLPDEETHPRTSVGRLGGDVRDQMVDDAGMPLLWRADLRGVSNISRRGASDEHRGD